MKTYKKITEISIEITYEDVENYINAMTTGEKLQLIDRTFKSIPLAALSDVEKFAGSLYKGTDVFSNMLNAFLKR